MDHVTSYFITAREICTLASFRLAARQKVRLSLIIGHAVALLAARARFYREVCGDPSAVPVIFQ